MCLTCRTCEVSPDLPDCTGGALRSCQAWGPSSSPTIRGRRTPPLTPPPPTPPPPSRWEGGYPTSEMGPTRSPAPHASRLPVARSLIPHTRPQRTHSTRWPRRVQPSVSVGACVQPTARGLHPTAARTDTRPRAPLPLPAGPDDKRRIVEAGPATRSLSRPRCPPTPSLWLPDTCMRGREGRGARGAACVQPLRPAPLHSGHSLRHAAPSLYPNTDPRPLLARCTRSSPTLRGRLHESKSTRTPRATQPTNSHHMPCRPRDPPHTQLDARPADSPTHRSLPTHRLAGRAHRHRPSLRPLHALRDNDHALAPRYAVRSTIHSPRSDRYALSARLSPREPAGPPIAQRHAQRSTHAQSSMRPRAGTHSSRGPAPSRTPRTASTCGHPGVGPRETRTGPTMRSTHPLLGHSLHSDRHRGPIPPLPSLAPHTLLARHATHLPAPRSLPETDMNSSRV